MNKIYYYTGILFLLWMQPFGSQIKAQCAACNITVNSSSGANYTLNNAQRVCITGGTYTGKVTLNHAGSSLCVDSTANFGGMLVQNSSDTVKNYGTWNAGNLTLNGRLHNYGSMTVSNVTINSGGEFYSNGSMLVINGNLTANKNFTSENDVTIDGNLTVNSNSIVTINGITVVNGNVTNNNKILFADSVSIGGNLTNNGSAEATFSNKAFIDGNVTNNNDLSFEGATSVTGNFTNNGSANLLINSGILNIEGNFTNNGTVSGGSASCGGVTVVGSSTNNGNFGTDGSDLDICDNGSGFDVNNGLLGTTITNCECTNGTVLPIELLGLGVRVLEDCAEFSWQTAVEIANDYFIIERSADGVNYINLAQVAGLGYSYRPVTYSYMDCSADAGGWYRLTQVDYDGVATSYPAVQAVRPTEEEPCKVFMAEGKILVQSTREIINVEIKNQLGQSVHPRQILFSNRNLDAQVELNGERGVLIIVVDFSSGKQEVFRILK